MSINQINLFDFNNKFLKSWKTLLMYNLLVKAWKTCIATFCGLYGMVAEMF
jgi:hypothetical protein